MTDPLSMAASIAGLITVGTKLITVLCEFCSDWAGAPASASYLLTEMKSMEVLLSNLQNIVESFPEDRKHLVMVEDLVLILTGSVITYSDLELFVDRAKKSSEVEISPLSRAKWVLKEKEIEKLLQKLQAQKINLILMLGVVQSDTLQEANKNVTELCTRVTKLMDDNHALAQKVRAVPVSTTKSRRTTINSQSILTNQSSETTTTGRSRRSITSLRDSIMSAAGIHDFDHILSGSRVYQARRGSSETENLSTISGLTVEDIEDISVLSLPLSKRDICNSDSYKFEIQKEKWSPFRFLSPVPENDTEKTLQWRIAKERREEEWRRQSTNKPYLGLYMNYRPPRRA
ncbi:hypothetical protein EDC01DRAFT_486962 [Geopyxis carbonaria]|nr:hypothetical protein EDC01DRAFT_486962 [Geopyxis carbonaria]